MSGTYTVVMGDRGRIVVPADVRKRAGLAQGDTLTLLESSGGLVLCKREQLLARVRSDLRGLDLVTELLMDRRRAAHREDTY